MALCVGIKYVNRVAIPLEILGLGCLKSNELMAHIYSHLYGLPTTGLRFFTVYGPWGRPDMAPMIFAKTIMEGKPIDVFDYGDMKRGLLISMILLRAWYVCRKKFQRQIRVLIQRIPIRVVATYLIGFTI